MNYSLKNIFSIKKVVSLIIIFAFGFFLGRQANAISITSDPAVSNLKATTATISWPTDENGDSQAYYVVSAGPAWSVENVAGTNMLIGLDMIGKSGWIVGQSGIILHTNLNFSNFWTAQTSGVTVNLLDVEAIDANTAWAVGANGTIIKTTNGGATWSKQVSGVNVALLSIAAIDGQQAWAVGDLGTVLHTVDGGLTWVKETSGVSNMLIGVEVYDANNGWAVGTSGTIIKTTNGGATWNRQTSGTTNALRKIAVIDSNNAWIAGIYDLILRTSNGGSTWISQTTGSGLSFNNIYALSINNACVVGGSGGFFCTNNAGTNWQNYTSISGNNRTLHAVYLAGANAFWAVGDAGTLVYYGISYDSYKSDFTQTTDHALILDNLLPLTSYYYIVCSQNNLAQEICSTDKNFTTLAACPDGTDDGSCNLSQQYCQGTTLMPLDGTKNCVHCGYTCPAATPYCNTTLQACEEKCLDGTSPDSCNAGLLYCDPISLQLSNNCSLNQTKCGYTCPVATPYCSSTGQCEEGCNSTTPVGSCFGTQYCQSANNFVNNCLQCGYICPAATPFCSATGQCLPGCNSTTPVGSCSGTQYCQSANNFVNNCLQCGYTCPASNIFCNTSNGLCEPGCNITTPVGSCSGAQYCQSANNFVNNCLQCGYICPAATPFCSATGQCLPACPDGTNFGQCNTASQYCCRLSGDSFCTPGQLSPTVGHNCQECSFDCSTTSTEPYCDATGTHACAEQCADGTARGGCNETTKQYCNAALQLVNDCRQCEYTCPPATPVCAEDTGLCEADQEPPVISNINIDPSYNSAILTFDTSEPAQADIAVLLNADCTLLHSFIGVADINTSFEVFIGNLLPSTTYYLNIGVWDTAEESNFASTGCPSSISFTTLAEPDLEAPVVRILTPTEGEEISASYNITVEASDNAGVTRVELILDSEASPFVTWTGFPYDYLFDTTTRSPGSHTLQATAYDSAGNSTDSDLVNFVIINDVAPPVLTMINVDVSLDEITGKRKAVITWETDEPATSRVDYVIEIGGDYDHLYGDDDECLRPGDCVKDESLTTSHSLELINLKANSRYHYRITSCDAKINCAH
ncbi:MAG: YCF48-related protein [Patescibacteria group bacterium]